VSFGQQYLQLEIEVTIRGLAGGSIDIKQPPLHSCKWDLKILGKCEPNLNYEIRNCQLQKDKPVSSSASPHILGRKCSLQLEKSVYCVTPHILGQEGVL